jgi:hypothetical protein
MPLIFLSYAVSDEEFVSHLVNDLKALGYKICLDCIDTVPDKPLLDRLLSVQKRVNFIVLVFSISSNPGTVAASEWNDVIIDNTLHGRNWLIPVWVENSTLHRHIFSDNVEDFRNSYAYSSAFQKLVTRIRGN